jgi:hypothetical protein
MKIHSALVELNADIQTDRQIERQTDRHSEANRRNFATSDANTPRTNVDTGDTEVPHRTGWSRGNALLECIREVLGSKLGRVTGYPN